MRSHTIATVTAAAVTTLILAVHLTGVRCKPIRIQACGKELADILQNTCQRGYNTYYQITVDENPSNSTRKKRGITQECCLQSCSFKDILQYCSGGTPLNNAIKSLLPDYTAYRVSKCGNAAAKSHSKQKLKLKRKPSASKLGADNNFNDDDEYEDDLCGGGTDEVPSTPPTPISTQPLPKEPHANVTLHSAILTPLSGTNSTGIHSTKPYFIGKTPVIVAYIGRKFNFGNSEPPST